MFSYVGLSCVCLLFIWQVYRIWFSMNSLNNICYICIEKYLEAYDVCKQRLWVVMGDVLYFLLVLFYFSHFFLP